MSFSIDDASAKKMKADLAQCLVNELFNDKINPYKFAQLIGETLLPIDGKEILSEADEQWKKKNTEIENGIIRELGSTANREQINRIMAVREKKFKTDYKLSKYVDMSNVSHEDVKYWLPEDKIYYNKDIFHNKLKSFDLTNLPPLAEKRILDVLEREAIGLNRQEVKLYFELIKINRLAAAIQDEKAKKQKETERLLKDYERNLFNTIFPKHMKIETLIQLNGGKVIPEETIHECIIDKIKNKQFQIAPYMVLFTQGKTKLFIQHLKELTQIASIWGDDPIKVYSLIISYILFNGVSENVLQHVNLNDNLQRFVSNMQHKEQLNTTILVHFLITFFYALSTQCLEISNKYQSSPEEQKVKLYKLYNGDERKKMILQNAINIANRAIVNFKGDNVKIISNFLKYVSKNNDIIVREDLFETIIQLD